MRVSYGRGGGGAREGERLGFGGGCIVRVESGWEGGGALMRGEQSPRQKKKIQAFGSENTFSPY